MGCSLSSTTQKMERLSVGKYFDQLRFVFLTSFVLFFLLLFLDYMALRGGGQGGIPLLLINFTNLKHTQKPGPSTSPSNLNESETAIGSPITIQMTNTTGVIHIPKNVIETVVPLAPSELGNSTEQMGDPPVIRESAEVFTQHPISKSDPCSGQYIYIHDLPSRFNEDLLKGCHRLIKWFDMCPYLSNLGLGPLVNQNPKVKVLMKNSWYATNQFSLEVIFHNKMKQYKCLAKNSSLASAMYVPYYAGLDVGQYLWGFNVSVRDASPKELVKWLAQQPEWKRMWGGDHFLVGGRIGFDFRRRSDHDSAWGNKLMLLPEARNMSLLPIELGLNDNDFPIPYPTHFHPSKDSEVFMWQKRMRRVKRPYLFAFAGAPRPDSPESIRNELIKHCQSSPYCRYLGCNDDGNKCDDPAIVIKLFQSSVFCLQPTGDSFTRRSTFDSILAGCIPVFFHAGSAYEQYMWHLPKDGSKYSVFIPEEDVKEKRVMINETLLRVPKSEVSSLRREVIRIIPRIIYGNPRFRLRTIEDAFDIAVKGILGRIETRRREIMNFKDSGSGIVN